LEELQRFVTAERYEQRVGRTVRALVDRVLPDGSAVARTVWQADDIDGVTRIAPTTFNVRAGALIDARIDGVVDDYDFEASVVHVVSTPATSERRVRALPIMTTSAGSWGR
jgi:hypothetical protein